LPQVLPTVGKYFKNSYQYQNQVIMKKAIYLLLFISILSFTSCVIKRDMSTPKNQKSLKMSQNPIAPAEFKEYDGTLLVAFDFRGMSLEKTAKKVLDEYYKKPYKLIFYGEGESLTDGTYGNEEYKYVINVDSHSSKVGNVRTRTLSFVLTDRQTKEPYSSFRKGFKIRTFEDYIRVLMTENY